MSIDKTTLKHQIEGFTNFDSTLTPGGGTKAVMSGLNAKSRDLYQVKPADIYVMPGLNPRVQNKAYYDGVEVLAEDIKEHGYYQDKPLAGYIAKIDGKDTIVLNDGHRRLAATLKAIESGAAIETVPIVIKDKSNSMLDLTVGLLKSNEGQPFTVYEKAVIAKRLKGYGWDNTKIAAEMRCTSAFVGQLLTLAGAPQAIADLVQSGNMSATQAHDLMKEHGNEDAAEIATQAVAKAKAAGRSKVTAKDLTPAEKRDKLSKKFGPRMFKLLKDAVDNEKTAKAMPEDLFGDIMALITEVETGARKKKAAELKPPKEPKAPKKAAKKAPAAKKTGGLAKAIATTAKKSDKPGSGAADFWAEAEKGEAERKAAKAAPKVVEQAASARGERRGRSHSERRAA
jgi:ParB family chromosome partitioning protein